MTELYKCQQIKYQVAKSDTGNFIAFPIINGETLSSTIVPTSAVSEKDAIGKARKLAKIFVLQNMIDDKQETMQIVCHNLDFGPDSKEYGVLVRELEDLQKELVEIKNT